MAAVVTVADETTACCPTENAGSKKHDIPSASQSDSRMLTRYPKWLRQWSAPVEVSGLIPLDDEQQSLPTRQRVALAGSLIPTQVAWVYVRDDGSGLRDRSRHRTVPFLYGMNLSPPGNCNAQLYAQKGKIDSHTEVALITFS